MDCNVDTLTDADLAWADLVFTGGMIPPQPSSLAMIEPCPQAGKPGGVGRHQPWPATPARGVVTLPGSMEIGQANERYKLGLSDADYQTVGGYVFGRLGRLPQPGAPGDLPRCRSGPGGFSSMARMTRARYPWA